MFGLRMHHPLAQVERGIFRGRNGLSANGYGFWNVSKQLLQDLAHSPDVDGIGVFETFGGLSTPSRLCKRFRDLWSKPTGGADQGMRFRFETHETEVSKLDCGKIRCWIPICDQDVLVLQVAVDDI